MLENICNLNSVDYKNVIDIEIRFFNDTITYKDVKPLLNEKFNISKKVCEDDITNFNMETILKQRRFDTYMIYIFLDVINSLKTPYMIDLYLNNDTWTSAYFNKCVLVYFNENGYALSLEEYYSTVNELCNKLKDFSDNINYCRLINNI